MQTTTIIDKHGRQRELRDGAILGDGERLIVPQNMMDNAALVLHDGMGNAAGHKPGYVFANGVAASISDAALSVARSEAEARLTGAWCNPAVKRRVPVADGQDVYSAYAAHLANAWRAP